MSGIRFRFARPLTSALVTLVIGTVALWLASGGALSASDTATPSFAYSGDEGPGFWGETPGWEACAAATPTARQSPIDIDRVVPDPHLGPLHLQLHETPLALTNNGHTIEEE